MLGVGPLLLAPLSESFGRRPLLVVLTFLITLLFLPQALAPNFASICATRFVQGAMGSVEGPVISGVVADLFPKISRGRAMATFVLAVYAGNACGPSISAAIVRFPSFSSARFPLLLLFPIPRPPHHSLSLPGPSPSPSVKPCSPSTKLTLLFPLLSSAKRRQLRSAGSGATGYK
jgi:MFS family permease